MATDTSHLEQELATILTHLNPPQQQYDVLADKLQRLYFSPSLPAQPSLVRTLIVYFGRFAQGYALWQGCYDYPKVREYFYGAYLQALREGSLSPQLKGMLEQMTEAMIAYTHCENALIANDPDGLFVAATRASAYGKAALEWLTQSSLDALLRSPIEIYLHMNMALFRGLELCAEMYLAPLRNKEIAPDHLNEVARILKFLEGTSRELASELKAHFSFAQRLARTYAQRNTDLRVEEGTLLWRVTGYLGEDLTSQLFARLKSDNTPGDMPFEGIRKAIRKQTGLPIRAVRLANLQDIFETVLGAEYLEQVIFELSTENDALTFSIHDGEKVLTYTVETFQVRLARFGAMSVEFGIFIQDASVSHIRVLESLIAPQAGQFDFIWRDAPTDSGRESIDYVDYFLRSRAWIASIRRVASGVGSPRLAEMEKVLVDWENALEELARRLPRGFTESAVRSSELTDREQAERLDSAYRALYQECFLRMRVLARQWNQEAAKSSALEEVVHVGKQIFSAGFHFRQLIDVAEEIVEHIKRYVSPEETDDVSHLFSFDASTGWATVLLCASLALVEHHGAGNQPANEWDYLRFTDHPEFKGLIIQSREARSALDDWHFVALPHYRNLATIRSHEHDIMYMGENRAFLYLPDDPQFLTAQYIDTVRLIYDIRTLVLTFNRSAKEQIKTLESFFRSKYPESDKLSSKSLTRSYNLFLSQRNQIEIFRTRAEKILDLLRACAVSKYQDHSDLLKAMMQENGLGDSRDSLEHNIMTLERFHTYLTEQLKRQIEDRSEIYARRTTAILFFLTLLSALSAIPAIPTIYSYLVALYPFLVNLVLLLERNVLWLLMGILLAGLVVYLVVRLRQERR